MDNKFFLFSSILILAGCTTQHSPVYVPISAPRPIIQLEPEPDLPVLHLTEKSMASEVAVAYVDSLIAQENHIRYLRNTIEALYDSPRP